MRLVACPTCHTQYDVENVIAEAFPCRCGTTVKNEVPNAVEVETHRCSACGALVQDATRPCDYCGSTLEVDPRKLSLICPECFARNADASRFCTGCGVAFQPEPVLAEGHELPCPVCTVLMPPRQLLGLALNECGSCNGVWVPGDSFDVLVQRALEARRQAGPDGLPKLQPRVTGSNPARQELRYRKCPSCDDFMQRRNFRKSSGVILDVCGQHGTWLDADELEQIAGFILSGGTTSPLLANERRETVTTTTAFGPEQRARSEFVRIVSEHTTPSRHEQGSTVGSLLDVLTRLLT